MRSLLTISALLELGAGSALLCCPSTAARLLTGESLAAAASMAVMRIGGAGLLALGIACGFARGDSRSRAAKGLVAAMLLYNAAVITILADAGLGFGLHGVLLWPGVIVHGAMAVWCVIYLTQFVSRMHGSP
jgi:hypothetical protein